MLASIGISLGYATALLSLLASIPIIGLIIASILILRSPFKDAPSYEIKVQVPEQGKLDPDASLQAWISDNLGTINSTLATMQDSLDKWKVQIKQKHDSYKRGLGVLRKNQYEGAIESLDRVFRVHYECISTDDDSVICLKIKHYSFEEIEALRKKSVRVDLREEVL